MEFSFEVITHAVTWAKPQKNAGLNKFKVEQRKVFFVALPTGFGEWFCYALYITRSVQPPSFKQ